MRLLAGGLRPLTPGTGIHRSERRGVGGPRRLRGPDYSVIPVLLRPGRRGLAHVWPHAALLLTWTTASLDAERLDGYLERCHAWRAHYERTERMREHQRRSPRGAGPRCRLPRAWDRLSARVGEQHLQEVVVGQLPGAGQRQPLREGVEQPGAHRDTPPDHGLSAVRRSAHGEAPRDYVKRGRRPARGHRGHGARRRLPDRARDLRDARTAAARRQRPGATGAGRRGRCRRGRAAPPGTQLDLLQSERFADAIAPGRGPHPGLVEDDLRRGPSGSSFRRGGKWASESGANL